MGSDHLYKLYGASCIFSFVSEREDSLEDQLRARSNGEAAGEDVAEPVIVKIPEPQDHDENREELIRRIAALERAVVELIASRSNRDQKN